MNSTQSSFVDFSEVVDPATLRALGLVNVARAAANLGSLLSPSLPDDLRQNLWQQLQNVLPTTSDPDRALNNLDRFFEAARSRLALTSLLERDPTGLPILMTLFSTSQYLSDWLIREPENYDFLRMTEGQLYAREVLVGELVSEMENVHDVADAMAVLRRFKHRETLRIGFCDLIAQCHVADITQQISWVAEAVCEAALKFAWQQRVAKWGTPKGPQGQPNRFAILAMGKLGGGELNYSSDIDLIFVYDQSGRSEQGRDAATWFDALARDFVKLLNEATDLGIAYRVDLRLRPEGSRGRMCNSLDQLLRYYDLQGRTWERQALIKARPVAGDLELGGRLLQKLEPWIYGRMLNRHDIAGIKALKRKIERRAVLEGEELTNLKTGFGGIRDIEFVIQFLQLLNGARAPEVRVPNTLKAIESLATAGALTLRESQLLSQNYQWLRKLEHRLQIMFDLQTHSLPNEAQEVERIAWRMGYREYFGQSPVQQFHQDLREITSVNRAILNHLLRAGFDDKDGDTKPAAPEIDLVLDPAPDPQFVSRTLESHGFQEPEQAYRHLISLSEETSLFLSSHRCRHFLASIAPTLLREIGQTPDPDATLRALAGVADSIGGKAVLWELFQFQPKTLDLFVRLCASSDYLTDILRRSPGMIDDLVDSLLLERLPDERWYSENLQQLLENAEDPDPILHSFKKAQHLRIGIRDITGRDSIQDTHRALADVAQASLQQITEMAFHRIASRYAAPNRQGTPANQMVILALGKLGGQEPNYHSDLDVIFLYDRAAAEASGDWESSPQHVYSELAAEVSRQVNRMGPYGKLYELDSRLRPTGKSGALAVSFDQFRDYFQSGVGELWERQALCKARPIFGDASLQRTVADLVFQSIRSRDWRPEDARAIFDMRLRMQEGSRPSNLKRGEGGTVDVEFLVQMLQLKFGDRPELIVPGTITALQTLVDAGVLDAGVGGRLIENYRLLRGVEARLRLMNTTARHDLPDDPLELKKLAYLLRIDADSLVRQIETARRENRELFHHLIEQHSKG